MWRQKNLNILNIFQVKEYNWEMIKASNKLVAPISTTECIFGMI